MLACAPGSRMASQELVGQLEGEIFAIPAETFALMTSIAVLAPPHDGCRLQAGLGSSIGQRFHQCPQGPFRIQPTRAGEHISDDHEQAAGDEEPDVVGQLVWTTVNVVQAQDVMIHQTFHEIEYPPPF